MKRRVMLWGVYTLPALLLVVLLGCPPLRFEDVYGYNTVVMRNRGDRPLVALFVIKQGQPGRGANYIEEMGELPPDENLVVPGLLNGVYNLEIEYMLSASEVYDGTPRRVMESMPGVRLYWGSTYSWYWYGPSDQILSDAMEPPSE